MLVMIHGQELCRNFSQYLLYTLNTHSLCLCIDVPKCVLVYACPHVSCFANRGGICFLCVCVYSSANRECVFVFLSTVRACVCTNHVVCVCVCACVNKVVIKPKSTTLQWGGFQRDSSPQRRRLHLLQSFLI